MQYLVTYAFETNRQQRDEAISRFLATGGVPPQGVKLLGRWTRTDMSGGIVLVESTDPKAMTRFSLDWSDVLHLETVPVIGDADLAAVLEQAR